ncbi:MAG: hypothetical protein QM650_04225 [Microlunatus sp.]
MSSAQVFESAMPVDAVLSRLVETQSWLSELVAERDTADAVTEATRIDRIALLERLQAGLEAVKNVEMVAFAKSRATEQVEAGVHPRKAGQGIADEIALACRISPTEGSRRLHTARDLVLDMPHTLGPLRLSSSTIGGF